MKATHNHDYTPQKSNGGKEVPWSQFSDEDRSRWLEKDVCDEEDQDDSGLQWC